MGPTPAHSKSFFEIAVIVGMCLQQNEMLHVFPGGHGMPAVRIGRIQSPQRRSELSYAVQTKDLDHNSKGCEMLASYNLIEQNLWGGHPSLSFSYAASSGLPAKPDKQISPDKDIVAL